MCCFIPRPQKQRKEDSKIRCLKSSQEFCSFFLLLSSAAVWLVLSLCSPSLFFQAFASTLRKSWLAPPITGWENIMYCTLASTGVEGFLKGSSPMPDVPHKVPRAVHVFNDIWVRAIWLLVRCACPHIGFSGGKESDLTVLYTHSPHKVKSKLISTCSEISRSKLRKYIFQKKIYYLKRNNDFMVSIPEKACYRNH